MKAITPGSIIAMALLGYSTQAQSLILNGGFESPKVPLNTFSTTVPDSWISSGYGGGYIGIINGEYGAGNPLPHSGQQYAHVGYSSSLSQVFTVSNSGKYVLRWFDSTEFNGPDQTSFYSMTVLDSGANAIVTKDLDANASGLRLWAQHSIELTLAPGAYTLRIDGHAGFFGEQTLLDDISIEPQGTCPCEGPVSGGAWKNHGQYVSCVAKAAEAALTSGQITEDEKDSLVEAAAQSDCGKK